MLSIYIHPKPLALQLQALNHTALLGLGQSTGVHSLTWPVAPSTDSSIQSSLSRYPCLPTSKRWQHTPMCKLRISITQHTKEKERGQSEPGRSGRCSTSLPLARY
eukprot:57229-Rhodomonas_salina.2